MSKKSSRKSSDFGISQIRNESGNSACLELDDSSVQKLSANFLLKDVSARDPQPLIARLANQLLAQNNGILRNFGILASVDYDGSSVNLSLSTSTRVGAIPLLSPTSGKPDYGLIIKPRFGWSGIGPMLGGMGWKIVPKPLRLPLLPTSDRRIPPWVLSTIILARIQALLNQLDRRFEYVEDNLSAPRGNVNWAKYATVKMPSAKFLDVPCRFPDLRDDRQLKGAIHYTLRKQLASLESQRSAGVVVLQLINFCQTLMRKVQNVVPLEPTAMMLVSWVRGPFKTEIFRDGLQAIEWTVEDQGLAGIGDLQGLPWVLSMEEFFEAWIETIAQRLVRQIGGRIRTGRKRETVAPLIWESSYVGSQKYLLPDVILERENETIIFDAKYKNHWEEMNFSTWGNVEEVIRERHREDLLQVLAYSTLFSTEKITSCLMYPCTKDTWDSLKARNRLIHRAAVAAGQRKVDLVLAAVPMIGQVDEIVGELAGRLKSA